MEKATSQLNVAFLPAESRASQKATHKKESEQKKVE
jgi:hypothetical protein